MTFLIAVLWVSRFDRFDRVLPAPAVNDFNFLRMQTANLSSLTNRLLETETVGSETQILGYVKFCSVYSLGETKLSNTNGDMCKTVKRQELDTFVHRLKNMHYENSDFSVPCRFEMLPPETLVTSLVRNSNP